MNAKTRTILLGFTVLGFLGLAFVENRAFFNYAGSVFYDPPFAIVVVFIHNVLVISPILLSMTFYVELALAFFPKVRMHCA